MYRSVFFVCLVCSVLSLSSCGGSGKALPTIVRGDTVALRYAEHLTLVNYHDYTVAILRNPWDTLKTLHTYILVPKEQELSPHLPKGTVVRTPLRRSLVYSSVHCGLLEKLGVFTSVGGVCDLKYSRLPTVHDACSKGMVVDCGDGMNPDMERIIDLQPDAVLLSPFENSGGYGRIEKLDVPIIECADYMETSALGRAEWMRFFGLLFGAKERADSLFAEVDSCYQQLKMRARRSSTSLSVISELKSGSAWYVPGGHSTMGRLFSDACGQYAFAEDEHSGSVPLAFETVFDKAGNADTWIIKYNRERDMTYADLQSDYIGYTAFRAFKTRNIYVCNTARVPFYEETPFRPDYLLRDLVQILHPEVTDLGDLRYFSKMIE